MNGWKFVTGRVGVDRLNIYLVRIMPKDRGRVKRKSAGRLHRGTIYNFPYLSYHHFAAMRLIIGVCFISVEKYYRKT